jgi:hypothetical protein
VKPGTASLFEKSARSRFNGITGQRYDAMAHRLAKQGLRQLPFTKDELRHRLLFWMGGRHDGAVKCQYCGRLCDLSEVEFDHAEPLSRGGSPGLENIDFPCAPCNQAKGSMKPREFALLLALLEGQLALARVDVLNRLGSYSKLLANKRRDEFRMRELEKGPRARPGKPPLAAMMDEAF